MLKHHERQTTPAGETKQRRSHSTAFLPSQRSRDEHETVSWEAGVDELIDRAHHDWPETTFVLSLPSGEEMLIPRHVSEVPPYADGHSGYATRELLPFSEDRYRHGRGGRCTLTPATDSGADVPTYSIELAWGFFRSTTRVTWSA